MSSNAIKAINTLFTYGEGYYILINDKPIYNTKTDGDIAKVIKDLSKNTDFKEMPYIVKVPSTDVRYYIKELAVLHVNNKKVSAFNSSDEIKLYVNKYTDKNNPNHISVTWPILIKKCNKSKLEFVCCGLDRVKNNLYMLVSNAVYEDDYSNVQTKQMDEFRRFSENVVKHGVSAVKDPKNNRANLVINEENEQSVVEASNNKYTDDMNRINTDKRTQQNELKVKPINIDKLDTTTEYDVDAMQSTLFGDQDEDEAGINVANDLSAWLNDTAKN